MELTPVQEKFIVHWGEMGTRWGINRTVAQIHALIYISPKPLNAEEIAALLSVARSNVSNSIRELQSWRLVKTSHVLGDRRDHFSTMTDVWEMFRVVAEERKRREIDPTIELLNECLAEAEAEKDKDPATLDKLTSLKEFFTLTDTWYKQLSRWPTEALVKFTKLGDKVLKLLKLG